MGLFYYDPESPKGEKESLKVIMKHSWKKHKKCFL